MKKKLLATLCMVASLSMLVGCGFGTEDSSSDSVDNSSSTCTHTYDNSCDADCNECGEERTPSEHVYDNACDADCNECGEERTPSEHVYDGEGDKDCNVCDEERELNKYTVTFDVDGGSAVETQTVEYGTSADELVNFTSTKDGYAFAGWTLADGTAIPDGATVTGDITVKAAWNVITYSAKIARADGSEETVEFTIENKAEKLAAIALTANDAQYTYAWTTALPTELALNNEQVFTETRTVNNYTVTFDVDGGSAVEAQTVPYGTPASALANFTSTKTGYEFAGWTLEDGTAIPDGATVTGNITVKAAWTASANTAYNVEIYLETLSGYPETATQTIAQTGTTDTTVALTTEWMAAQGLVIPEGYALDNDKSVFSGTIAADGSLVLKVYLKLNEYTVTIDGVASTAKHGSTIVLPENPTQDGYIFKEWQVDGVKIDETYVIAGDTTVVAAWWEDLTDDSDVQAVISEIEEFNDNFVTVVTPENYQTVKTAIEAVEASYANLSENQQMFVSNYEDYQNTLKKFYVIDGMTSGAGSNFAKLNGTNGFVNLTSWQDISAAALTEAANAYGGAATIGANAQTDIVFHYTARADLDLSGYTHVTFAVRNGKSTAMAVYLYNTVGTWGRRDCLATGIAKATSNTDFTTIVMTVEQFQNYYIDFYYETTASGNIWITPMIAVQATQETQNVIALIAALDGTETKVAAARTAYDALSDAEKVYVSNYATLVEAEKVLASSDEDVQALIAQITAFNTKFAATSPEYYNVLSADITAIDEAYAALSTSLQSGVENYDAYLANKNSFCVIEDMSTGLADRIAIGGGAFSAKTPYNGNSTLTTYAAIYGGVGSFGLTQAKVVWRWANRDTLDLSGYTYVTFTIRHNLANGLKISLLDKSSWSETKVIQENLASSTASTSTPFTVITMTVEEYLSSLICFTQPTTAQGNIWMSSFIAHN